MSPTSIIQTPLATWRNRGAKGSDKIDLAHQVHIMISTGKVEGGLWFYKDSDKDADEQPLILAICTPLMPRLHKHIQKAKELVFIDSSFEDFNNPMFVLSTSSAAGGLPLGTVITSASASASANIHKAMNVLSTRFPEEAFYGQGSPAKCNHR